MYNQTTCRHEALTTSNFIQKLYGTKFLFEISHNKKIAVQPATAMNMDKKQRQPMKPQTQMLISVSQKQCSLYNNMKPI